ncbi:unnamed protein product [Orchesella dallaii]|uniref:Uncharacterized protein n=1 Tax=Orchesella dallaii TaxID=48710 RepID=A0ABP1PR01_9HEXA
MLMEMKVTLHSAAIVEPRNVLYSSGNEFQMDFKLRKIQTRKGISGTTLARNGRVICCDYPDCRKVCHYQCVGLKRPPSKDWCCPDHPEGVITRKKSPNQKLARAKTSSAAAKIVNSTNLKTPKIKPLKSEPGSLKRKLATVVTSSTQTTQPKQRRSAPSLTVSPPQKRIPALLETPKSAIKKAPVLRNSKTNLCDEFWQVIPPSTPPSVPLPVLHSDVTLSNTN